jgi:hypothetical protein
MPATVVARCVRPANAKSNAVVAVALHATTRPLAKSHQSTDRTKEKTGPTFPQTRHLSPSRVKSNDVAMVVRYRSASVTARPDFSAMQSRHIGRSNNRNAIIAA